MVLVPRGTAALRVRGPEPEVMAGLFVHCSCSPPALEAQTDYRTGTQPQSVFIRERSKLIQEGSGPLIHLKRQMKGGWQACEGSHGLF